MEEPPSPIAQRAIFTMKLEKDSEDFKNCLVLTLQIEWLENRRVLYAPTYNLTLSIQTSWHDESVTIKRKWQNFATKEKTDTAVFERYRWLPCEESLRCVSAKVQHRKPVQTKPALE